MMHTATITTALQQLAYAEPRGPASWMSDDELTLALRAAGASAEDVKRCLARERLRSALSRRVSQRKYCVRGMRD